MSKEMLRIKLTENEKQLFHCLVNSLNYTSDNQQTKQLVDKIDRNNIDSKDNKQDTIIRIAGGWVRDKLLGYDSNDIDIALNNQSGIEFATSVNKYLDSIGQETRTIAVIQANPDQSKHLETANIRILGYEIDCVNLRVESYTDSRIPMISIGTPLEDALRRDFTINAMFYNLHTNEIEDNTQLGLQDLSIGMIRTPISPTITFKDDPLRILRAIRFASRFNFHLDNELQAAVLQPDIKVALLTKVSRERVYKECEGCINQVTSRPSMAIYWWYHLDILDAIIPIRDILSAYPTTDYLSPQLPQYHPPLNQQVIFPLIHYGRDCSYHTADVDQLLIPLWMHASYYTSHWLNLLLSLKQQQQSGHFDTRSLFKVWETCHGEVSRDMQSSPKPCIDSSRKTLFWAVLCVGLSGIYVQDKKKVISPLIPIALRESLKMETTMIRNVQIMIDATNAYLNIYKQSFECSSSNTTTTATTTTTTTTTTTSSINGVVVILEAVATQHFIHIPIEQIGLLLCACKEMWRDSLLLACAVQLMLTMEKYTQRNSSNPLGVDSDRNNNIDVGANHDRKPYSGIKRNIAEENKTIIDHPNEALFNTWQSKLFQNVDLKQSPECVEIITRFLKIQDFIEEKKLDEIWLVKPLFNGTELITLLGVKKGPMIGKLMEQQLIWQIIDISSSSSSSIVMKEEYHSIEEHAVRLFMNDSSTTCAGTGEIQYEYKDEYITKQKSKCLEFLKSKLDTLS